LRAGFLDLLTRSIRPVVQRRNLGDQINDVKTAFSSWDNCMQVAYCKWPVIGLIIAAGLIIFGVTWCIIRCACCGLSCCCSCFKCLKCCGDCCGCCDPPRGNRRKYLDEPYIPPNHGGYKPQPPMFAGFGGSGKAADVPQYAEFDVSKPKDPDALPQMPTWEKAESKKVFLEEEEEGVEMNNLKKPEDNGQTAAPPTGAVPSRAVTPVSPRSPTHPVPYGPPGANAPTSNDQYGTGPGGYGSYVSQGAPDYNQPSMPYPEDDQGYSMPGTSRHLPQSYNNSSYNNGACSNGYSISGYNQGSSGYDNYGSPQQQQQPYDNYDIYNAYDTQPTQGYSTGYSQPTIDLSSTSVYGANPQSPAPSQHGPYNNPYSSADARRSPAPQGPYGNGYGSRHQSPAPQDYPAPTYSQEARRSPVPRNVPAPLSPGGSRSQDPRMSPVPMSPRSPGPRSPAPYAREYGGQSGSFDSTNSSHRASPYGQRQYTPDPTQPLRAPPPQRSYTGDFDFSTSGHSRPTGNGAYADSLYGDSTYASQGQGSNAGTMYPGYKPYQSSR